jgi:tRNA(Arg) A34 adenosine deaminase TadA
MSRSSDHERLDELVDQVIGLSTKHVCSGGIPFAALVIDNLGNILGTGVNEVSSTCDPTAHAEVVAIRDSCRRIHRTRLSDATLIASGEPCALCYMVAASSGIRRVVFAADRLAAATAGFDYRRSYDLLAVDPRIGPLQVHQHHNASALEPFSVWLERKNKIVAHSGMD